MYVFGRSRNVLHVEVKALELGIDVTGRTKRIRPSHVRLERADRPVVVKAKLVVDCRLVKGIWSSKFERAHFKPRKRLRLLL